MPALLTLVEPPSPFPKLPTSHVSVGMAWKLVGSGEWPSFPVGRNRLVPPPGFFETGPQFLTILHRQREDAVGHGQEDRAEPLEGLIDDIDSDA